MLQNKNKYYVYLTADTVRGMLLETGRHPGNECIIQMPGLRIGNEFFFDMVADSGINATYTYGMCEKDHVYADHLSTRLSEYYDFSNGTLTVSQVHKHPPGYDHFSSGDLPANSKLAVQFGGVVNGLILVDPRFRIKFWYIDQEGHETPAEYEINDQIVRSNMPRISLKKLKKTVETNEMNALGRRADHKCENAGRSKFTFRNRVLNLFRSTAKVCSFIKDRESEVKRMQTDNMTLSANIVDDTNIESVKEYGKNAEVKIDFESLRETLRPYRVLLPEEYLKSRYEGALIGYYIPETKTYNVLPDTTEERTDILTLGTARRVENPDFGEAAIVPEQGLSIVWKDDTPEIHIKDNAEVDVMVEYYSLDKDVFSRNKGILEQSRMSSKQAVIAGGGSGGFKVGMDLVRAGIGSVIIADDDVMAYHNVGRHVCGIHDVGRYKVDCFRERAADINPNCKVYTFRELIQHIDPAALAQIIWKDSIILCCADNRHAGYVCNELADKYHIPMIDAGCGPRASTGEVFFYKPDSGMACYTCTYGKDNGVDYSNQAIRRRFYATEIELEKMHFQPGMFMDIELTAIFEAKLAVDLLMEGEEGYEMKLLPYIDQCTILLNYPVEPDVNPYMRLFGNDKQNRRPFTWKSGAAEKNENCSYCCSAVE